MYLFFDTETTGIPENWKAPLTDFENWPRLVQLAYQIFDIEGNLIMEGDYIIKPDGYTIPIESSRIHGITNERARSEGENLLKVLENFKFLIDEAHTIVAHNLDFDEKIVGCEYLRMGFSNPLVEKNRICTMKSLTNYCAIDDIFGYKYPNLSELYFKLFNTELEETNNALVDIRATSKCFWELVNRDIINLSKPSLFNPNNSSRNQIEDEKALLSDDQIKDLIEEYLSLKKKLKSVGKRWNFLNNVLSGCENYEKMKEEIEEWEALDSLLTEYQSELDNVICLLEEQGMIEESDSEIPEKTLKIGIAQITSRVNYDLGNERYKSKDYKDAIDYYSQAIELDTNFAAAYNDRGNAKYSLKDFTGAIDDYSKAIEIKPKYDFAYNGRGSAKASLKDYDGAIVDYSKAIRLNPNYAAAHKNLEKVMNHLGLNNPYEDVIAY